MRQLFIIFCMLFGLYVSVSGIVDSRYFSNSHDINALSHWGPYSVKYAGISHVNDIDKGVRFDFSVMPGYYRNKQLIPNALFESAYYPWEVNPSMTKIKYRYELEWKSKVYVDVTYFVVDESQTLVEITCVNNTSENQNLMINNIAYIDYSQEYPINRTINSEQVQWKNAIDYIYAESDVKFPQYNLVYDGWFRFEERSNLSLDGSLLSKGFGSNKGDKVAYNISIDDLDKYGKIVFRYRVAKSATAKMRLTGLIDTTLYFVGSGEFDTLHIPYKTNKKGIQKLELKSDANVALELDGFFWGDIISINSISFDPENRQFTPNISDNKERSLLLKYPDVDTYYGISWKFSDFVVREFLNDELDILLKRKTHDHVARRIVGNSLGHFTNIYFKPIVLTPHSQKTNFLLLCHGDKESVIQKLSHFQEDTNAITKKVHDEVGLTRILPEGKKYAFGNQLLQASLLTNIIYPVYTQKSYIRHFTPGKNWNSLYTWDNGFIALGLIDIDPVKAFECIRAYTTEKDAQSAFIHHGTPLPIHFFAYLDLWNEIQSMDVLKFLYPRLKQYYDFITTLDEVSKTRMKGSNLLKTWSFFYNSGGWDDYPPQQQLRGNRSQYDYVTPVVTTAYYIRAAKILRMTANVLGLKNDIKKYNNDIKEFSEGLHKYSWDSQSGYFSYVVHDIEGNANEIYKYKDGSNYNKGLDGVSPLIAGICTHNQTERLINHIFNSNELWTPYGISTVDQSAPYYKHDGYWNGAVWMPHQWTIWKSLLDLGEGDLAYQVAKTALDLWEEECNKSHHTFEHFIIDSGRGAGWHQFSGLSAPILNWYSSYFKIGKVTTGFEVMLFDEKFDNYFSQYEATLKFDDSSQPHKRNILLCLNPNYSYKVNFDGIPIDYKMLYDGLIQITLPSTNKSGKLLVRKEILNH